MHTTPSVTSVPRKTSRAHPLEPADEYLLGQWAEFLRLKNWSPSSIQRALNRLRAVARDAKRGLCGVEKEDVAEFAHQRCVATGMTVATLVRSENWREMVRTIRTFYGWTRGRWTGVNADPTVGLVSAPTRSRGPSLKARDGRLYERVLAAPGISCRDRAILFALAHGLTPGEVAHLPAQTLNLGSRHLLVPSGQARVIPLTRKAVRYFAEWVATRWPSDELLFSGIGSSAIRAVVRRAAAATFPHPSQLRLRRRIYTNGFRDLFLLRAVVARVAPDCLRELTGVDRLSRLAPFAKAVSSFDRLSRELDRMTARRPGWI
jgi:site-specific recombinase XerC